MRALAKRWSPPFLSDSRALFGRWPTAASASVRRQGSRCRTWTCSAAASRSTGPPPRLEATSRRDPRRPPRASEPSPSRPSFETCWPSRSPGSRWRADTSSRGENGRQLQPNGFRKHQWARAVRAAGLGPLILHDLRRTCAAILVKTGATLQEIAKSLGHKYEGITSDRYAEPGVGCHRRGRRPGRRLPGRSGPWLLTGCRDFQEREDRLRLSERGARSRGRVARRAFGHSPPDRFIILPRRRLRHCQPADLVPQPWRYWWSSRLWSSPPL